MSSTTLFLIAIVAAGGLALLGIVAVAVRRDDKDGPVTQADLDPNAVRAEAARLERERAAAGAVATLERTDLDTTDESAVLEEPPLAPFPDPALERTEITAAEYGVTRRKFFNRAIYAVWGLFLAQFTIASLAFVWPKLRGGFGTPINAGNVDDLKAEVIQGATVVPKFIAAAQSWIVPFSVTQLEGSSYGATPFVVAGGKGDGIGLMALWQRCPHLGCRVPECISSQGFECPCHGSKYNIHGEYEAGPAPRNLDRFGVEVSDSGDLIIDTGNIVQTARSKNKTAPYPEGPFCV